MSDTESVVAGLEDVLIDDGQPKSNYVEDVGAIAQATLLLREQAAEIDRLRGDSNRHQAALHRIIQEGPCMICSKATCRFIARAALNPPEERSSDD